MVVRRSVWVGAVLALILAVAVVPVGAQGGLEQTVVAADGSFSAQFPGDWFALESDGVILGVSTQAVFETILAGEAAAPGDMLVMVPGPAAMVAELEIEPEMDLMAIGEAMADSLGSDLEGAEFGEMEILPLPDGREAVVAEVNEGGPFAGGFFILDDGSGEYLGVIVLAHADTLEEMGDTLFDMILSAQRGTPETVDEGALESAELVWAAPDVLENMSGGIAVVGDQIFIADGSNGLLVFSPDGEQTGSVVIEDVFTLSSPVATADGNLWVTNSFDNEAYLITPDGEVLVTIGGEDVFSGFEPNFVAVGPDGNVYLSDSPDEGDAIQVWSPEGEFLRSFPMGDAESMMWDVDMAPDGSIYAWDLGTGNIVVFDGEGAVVNESFAKNQIFFQFIAGFSPLADGTFLLGREALEGEDEVFEIVHLDAEGKLLGSFTAADLGLDVIRNPLSFAQLDDGSIVATDADSEGSQVFRFTILPPAE